MNDSNDMKVLITGGTAGIGRATGLAFAALGARVALTYNWGAHDADELCAAYRAVGASEPLLIEADASKDEHTHAAVEALLTAGWDRVDAMINNVAFAALIRDIDDFDARALEQSVRYSAWPIVAYPRAIHERMGAWPRYIVGVSSQGTTSVRSTNWTGERDVMVQRMQRAKTAGAVGLIATLDWSFSMGRDWGSPETP